MTLTEGFSRNRESRNNFMNKLRLKTFINFPSSSIGKSIAEIQLRKRYNIYWYGSREVLADQISMIPGGISR